MLPAKQKIIDLALKKKNLNKSERNSLLRSIHRFCDFGNEAETYLKNLKVPTSIILSYALFLNKLGVPVLLCRESERYNFMLYLSLQQTWNHGLGQIIQETAFIPVGKSEKPKNYTLTEPGLTRIIQQYGVPDNIIEDFIKGIEN